MVNRSYASRVRDYRYKVQSQIISDEILLEEDIDQSSSFITEDEEDLTGEDFDG